MSPHEKQVLQKFLQQLGEARGVVKDPEADAMIERAVTQQADAPYLLVQRALLLAQALDNAKDEIAALQSQVRRGAQSTSSFLDPGTWGNSGFGRAVPLAQSAQHANAPYQPPPQATAAGASPGFMRGGMGGMGGLLGTAAATAAGVAGGAFLFHGIGNLLGRDDDGKELLGQQDDRSAQNAFPGLTRPGENDSAGDDLASDTSQDQSAPSSDTSSDLVDDQGGDFFDEGGGDDSLFS